MLKGVSAARRNLVYLLLGSQRSERELEGAGREDGSVRVSQGESLFRRERVRSGLRVVFHVAAGRLAAKPLIDVAGGGAGALGEFAGQHRLPGERAIKAQPVTDELGSHHIRSGWARRDAATAGVAWSSGSRMKAVVRWMLLRGCGSSAAGERVARGGPGTEGVGG